MEEKIKIGDIVRLKSGGPKMTVKEIDEDGINCVYFNEITQIQGRFKCDGILLIKVN